MYSIIFWSKLDKITLEKEKIINSAFKHLVHNLKLRKIRTEILFGYFGVKNDLFFSKLISKHNNEYITFKIIHFTDQIINAQKSIKDKKNIRCIFDFIINNLIEKSKFTKVILKAQDTFFNKKIFDFLIIRKNNPKIFYNTFRYDCNLNFNKSIQNLFLKQINNKNFFLKKNKFINNYKNYLFMDLHSNAIGDFILFDKKKFTKVKFPMTGFYEDCLFVYDLYFHGGIQYNIQNGGVFKILSGSSHLKRISICEINIFYKFIEKVLYKFFFNSKYINIIRGVMNYPKILINNQKYDSYARQVYIKIFIKGFLSKILK